MEEKEFNILSKQIASFAQKRFRERKEETSYSEGVAIMIAATWLVIDGAAKELGLDTKEEIIRVLHVAEEQVFKMDI